MIDIKGARLHLRPLQAYDLADFIAYRKDPDVCRYQGFDPFTEKQAKKFIAEQANANFDLVGEWMQIGIEAVKDHRLIGDCAVKFRLDTPQLVELGYTINPQFQRKGFATEAIQLLIQHLFQAQKVHKAIAQVDARNQASLKLLERLGFELEGKFRQHFYDDIDHAWVDEWQYGLLKTDFNRINS